MDLSRVTISIAVCGLLACGGDEDHDDRLADLLGRQHDGGASTCAGSGAERDPFASQSCAADAGMGGDAGAGDDADTEDDVGSGLCGPSNCAGCCDGDRCLVGDDDDACGTSGRACLKCESPQMCGGGFCTNPGSCAATCAGCCVGETCMRGNVNDSCGYAGFACQACPDYARCDPFSAGEPEHTCMVIENTSWKLVITRLTVPSTTYSGGDWDALGNAPDPFVRLQIGSKTFTTPSKSDTYTVTTAMSVGPFLASEIVETLVFDVFDEDVSSHDTVGSSGRIYVFGGEFNGSNQNLSVPRAGTNSGFELTWHLEQQR